MSPRELPPSVQCTCLQENLHRHPFCSTPRDSRHPLSCTGCPQGAFGTQVSPVGPGRSRRRVAAKQKWIERKLRRLMALQVMDPGSQEGLEPTSCFGLGLSETPGWSPGRYGHSSSAGKHGDHLRGSCSFPNHNDRVDWRIWSKLRRPPELTQPQRLFGIWTTDRRTEPPTASSVRTEYGQDKCIWTGAAWGRRFGCHCHHLLKFASNKGI